jgi:quinol monooxygenase YgiN
VFDPDDPRKFILYEIYDDEAAFDRHLETPHYKNFLRATTNMIESSSVRRLAFFDRRGVAK